MNAQTRKKAYSAAGFRERFALTNGTPEETTIHGNKCIKFTYSASLEYQDANGAIFDTVRGEWIN